MVIFVDGAAENCREGVHHARLRRLDTETPMGACNRFCVTAIS